jgi:hypothetical protein
LYSWNPVSYTSSCPGRPCPYPSFFSISSRTRGDASLFSAEYFQVLGFVCYSNEVIAKGGTAASQISHPRGMFSQAATGVPGCVKPSKPTAGEMALSAGGRVFIGRRLKWESRCCQMRMDSQDSVVGMLPPREECPQTGRETRGELHLK